MKEGPTAMSSAIAVPRAAWADHAGRFIHHTFVVVEAELRKLIHDPMELLTRAVQPLLWLLVFGGVFARVRGIPTGAVGYREFLTPGILAQSGLFIAIFYGIAVIWERDLGVLQKYLVSPAPRSALVLGKAIAAGFRGLSQAILVYALALLLGVRLRLGWDTLLGVPLIIVLGSAVFATLSLIVACLVKTRERFMGIGQLLTMPLFFASNAIYPLGLMPGWLRVISAANPLTYQVDALRALMLPGVSATFGIGFDVAVQLAVLAVLVVLASRLYPKVVL